MGEGRTCASARARARVVVEPGFARVASANFTAKPDLRLEGAQYTIAGLDTGAVARLIGKSWLKQTFRHGFVHCDPHAGNAVKPRSR